MLLFKGIIKQTINNQTKTTLTTITKVFNNKTTTASRYCYFTKITNNNKNNKRMSQEMVFENGTTLSSLGDRMKGYEDNMKIVVEKNKSFIIRLDGHSFSKFSKAFKPGGSGVAWDIRIHHAMIETSTALMKTFMPSLIYTFSDEITMCFPSIDESTLAEGDEIPNLAYSGKVQKLITLTAGLASTVFYKSIINASYDADKDGKIIKLLESATPHFDSRLFVLPSNDEIRNNLVWRSIVDCKRNSVAGLGHAYFSPKEMHGLSNTEVKKRLLDEKGIDYDNEPAWYRYGVYLKKQYYILHTTIKTPGTKTSSDGEGEKPTSAIRSKVVPFSFDITKLSNSSEFITTKTLAENFKLELTSTTTTTVDNNK